jgi:hypothetical protein
MRHNEQHKIQLVIFEHVKLTKYNIFTSSTKSYLQIIFYLQKNIPIQEQLIKAYISFSSTKCILLFVNNTKLKIFFLHAQHKIIIINVMYTYEHNLYLQTAGNHILITLWTVHVKNLFTSSTIESVLVMNITI